MPIIRPNVIRIKRFRKLRENLRTRRDRLLVGIDIAKRQHVAQIRLAHTRVLEKQRDIPNTQAGFTEFWERLQAHRAAKGVTEIVCAVERTGTYHEAPAQFLEARGADVELVSKRVAHHNRQTLDGTWGKSDPKDAHNLGDLLERGHVLLYTLPDAQVATLRRLVRLLRHARVELGACRARCRNTLLPLLGPAADAAAGPAETSPDPALPPGLACELTDLTARLTAVQGRIAQVEAALVRVAQALPAYTWLRPLPGVGPTVAAILLADIGDTAWDHEVQPTPEARGAGHPAGTDWAVHGHGADLEVWPPAPPLGPLPGRSRRVPESGVARPPRGAAGEAGGGSARLLQGDRGTRGEAPAPHLGIWRSGRPHDPRWVGQGPAVAPVIAHVMARAGRRGAPLRITHGQAEIAKSSGTQAARISDRGAVDRRTRTSVRT